MPDQFSFTATDEDAGKRLDVFLTERLEDVSRARVQKLIEQQRVTVNGNLRPARARLEQGDTVTGEIKFDDAPSSRPQQIPLDVVYEDEHLLVINKQRGLTVHPGSGRPDGTLVNALAARYPSLPEGAEPGRAGIVHRLDKDTSGLMVVALSAPAMAALQTMIATHEIERTYLSLVWGSPRFNKAVVDAAIGRHPRHPEKMTVLPEAGPTRSRSSVTHLEVTERFDVAALVEARLETGRTHQIRVHCAYAGHPVVADPLYCKQTRLPDPYTPREDQTFQGLVKALAGQALHSMRLSMNHPVTGIRLEVACDPPPEMLDLVQFFRSHTVDPPEHAS